MTDRIARLTTDGIAPQISRPDPARRVAGDPVHTTWNIEERDGLYCGIWQSTPGAWRIAYDEWEYCHILSGHCVITGDDGTTTTLRAGDSLVLRPGFTGIWEVIETVTKDYVIRL